MSGSIIDVSRDFFNEVVQPILEKEFPAETAQTAFGVFGYGSEVLRMDDDVLHRPPLGHSHQRPDARGTLQSAARGDPGDGQRAPAGHRGAGYSLRDGFSGGTGLSLTSLEVYLTRTIGIDHPPQTYAEWLSIPEEDIIHVVNGEVWHDPSGRFTSVARDAPELLS